MLKASRPSDKFRYDHTEQRKFILNAFTTSHLSYSLSLSLSLSQSRFFLVELWNISLGQNYLIFDKSLVVRSLNL